MSGWRQTDAFSSMIDIAIRGDNGIADLKVFKRVFATLAFKPVCPAIVFLLATAASGTLMAQSRPNRPTSAERLLNKDVSQPVTVRIDPERRGSNVVMTSPTRAGSGVTRLVATVTKRIRRITVRSR